MGWIELLVASLIYMAYSKMIFIIEFIKTVNSYSGLFTLLSVLVILYIFWYNKDKENKDYEKKQRSILKTLKFELQHIKKDLEGHEKNFIIRKDHLGFFPIKQLNKFYYLHEIDDLIFKQSSELKDSLTTLYDKIVLFNNYLKYIMKDFNDNMLGGLRKINNEKALFDQIQNEIKDLKSRPIYFYWKKHAKIIMDDMRKEIEKSLEILKVI